MKSDSIPTIYLGETVGMSGHVLSLSHSFAVHAARGKRRAVLPVAAHKGCVHHFGRKTLRKLQGNRCFSQAGEFFRKKVTISHFLYKWLLELVRRPSCQVWLTSSIPWAEIQCDPQSKPMIPAPLIIISLPFALHNMSISEWVLQSWRKSCESD